MAKAKGKPKKKTSGPNPKNKALYSRVKAEAKRKFDVWPLLTPQRGSQESTRSVEARMAKGGLKKWFAEEWVDVKTGKKCGRSGKEKRNAHTPHVALKL